MRAYGHGILAMDRECRDRFRAAIPPPEVADLAGKADTDQTLAGLLTAVDRYSQAGRFRSLDTLGERPPDPSLVPT